MVYIRVLCRSAEYIRRTALGFRLLIHSLQIHWRIMQFKILFLSFASLSLCFCVSANYFLNFPLPTEWFSRRNYKLYTEHCEIYWKTWALRSPATNAITGVRTDWCTDEVTCNGRFAPKDDTLTIIITVLKNKCFFLSNLKSVYVWLTVACLYYLFVCVCVGSHCNFAVAVFVRCMVTIKCWTNFLFFHVYAVYSQY